MKFRIGGIAAVAAAILLFAPGLAQAKAPRIFDGEGLSVKPASLSGWTSSGDDISDPVLIAGRTGNPEDGLGPIDWQFWKKTKAVGKGRGWTIGDTAESAVPPWNGTKVRVTAYGRKDGTFRKLKVFEWTAWLKVKTDEQENYSMNLQLQGGKWVVVSIDDGLGLIA